MMYKPSHSWTDFQRKPWETDMMIIDSHLDLSWNALNWKRDLTKSIEEIRRSEAGMNDRKPRP